MIAHLDLDKWTPHQVISWLSGLCDDSSWLNRDHILNNNIRGENLLLMTATDLKHLGALKIDLQEHVLEAIETLRSHCSPIPGETLQFSILSLACLARSLHKQLSLQSSRLQPKEITLSKDFVEENKHEEEKQVVSLETLSLVSAIVKKVDQITSLLSHRQFSKNADYRSMKSLLLALSIELTSTAQRDRFVQRPNDIIEKSSKALADYCDRIVYGTKDLLLIQPFQIETVRIRKNHNEREIGLTIMSQQNGSAHLIEKIAPLSPADKTNQLSVGDEIILFNQLIIGWSTRNVERIFQEAVDSDGVTLVVKKCPAE